MEDRRSIAFSWCASLLVHLLILFCAGGLATDRKLSPPPERKVKVEVYSVAFLSENHAANGRSPVEQLMDAQLPTHLPKPTLTLRSDPEPKPTPESEPLSERKPHKPEPKSEIGPELTPQLRPEPQPKPELAVALRPAQAETRHEAPQAVVTATEVKPVRAPASEPTSEPASDAASDPEARLIADSRPAIAMQPAQEAKAKTPAERPPVSGSKPATIPSRFVGLAASENKGTGMLVSPLALAGARAKGTASPASSGASPPPAPAAAGGPAAPTATTALTAPTLPPSPVSPVSPEVVPAQKPGTSGSTASPSPQKESPRGVVHREEPVYPAAARRQGWQGTVRLQITVSVTGKVVGAEVITSSGYRALDEAAERAVRRWRFEPRAGSKSATSSGESVEVRRVSFVFKLD